MPSPDFKVFVKAHTIKDGEKEGHKGQLGACPFSMRVLLLLEEKTATYELDYINMDKKPEWVNKVNPQGTVPILKDNDTDAYIIDSDTISDYLEEKYAPGSDVEKKVLGKLVDCPQPGANVWPRFMDFLSGSGDKGAVEAELRQVEDVVGDKSPYVGGRDVNAWDVALAPRLYLARVVCKNIKGWDFGDDFPNVKAYLMRWTGRPSWRNTASWDEESIVEDFKAKLAKSEN